MLNLFPFLYTRFTDKDLSQNQDYASGTDLASITLSVKLECLLRDSQGEPCALLGQVPGANISKFKRQSRNVSEICCANKDYSARINSSSL